MAECGVLECTQEAGKWGDRDRPRRFCPAHTGRRGRAGATGTSRPGMTHGEKVSVAIAAHHPERAEVRLVKRLEHLRVAALRTMARPLVTRNEARLLTFHTCRECGAQFLLTAGSGPGGRGAHKSRVLCSRECARLDGLRQVKVYQKTNPVGIAHRKKGKKAARRTPAGRARQKRAKARRPGRSRQYDGLLGRDLTRRQVAERDEYRCQLHVLCEGTEVIPLSEGQEDHIVPLSILGRRGYPDREDLPEILARAGGWLGLDRPLRRDELDLAVNRQWACAPCNGTEGKWDQLPWAMIIGNRGTEAHRP